VFDDRARAIAAAAADDGVSISAISVWEVAKKVEKQQLVLDRPPRDYAHVQTAW
jgi:PIN domain nuclease of toxin-antitoxin system